MANPRKRLQEDHAVRPRKRRVKGPSLDYTSKHDEKDYRPSHKVGGSTRGNVRRPDKNIVHRPDEKSLRDPFRVLAGDIVFLIIDQLPARDTEILRRVSKLWKTSSEAHCGRHSLQKHFPLFAARVNERGSREKENLRFRRCLYHRESLSLGYATRAIQCAGAVDWHLNHDTLVWSNTRGDISIRRLRNSSDHLPDKSQSTAINLLDFHQPFRRIKHVQLVEGGDMIVNLRLSEPPPSEIFDSLLLRVTTSGTVLWRKELEGSIGRPALGKKAVYIPCYRASRPLSLAARMPRIALLKVSLEDGSAVYRTQLDFSQLTSVPAVADNRLQLTKDENFAVWVNSPYIYVWSTETGNLVITQSMVASPSITPLPPYDEDEVVWDITSTLYEAPDPARSSTKRVKLKKSPLTIKMENLFFPPGFDSPIMTSPVDWCFDGDHSTFFRLSHAMIPSAELEWRFLGMTEDTDVSTNIAVAPMEVIPSEYAQNGFDVLPTGKPSHISLPSRSGTRDRTRLLEADLPWEMANRDFLGMENEYLVYHAPSEATLLLVDFWPDW